MKNYRHHRLFLEALAAALLLVSCSDALPTETEGSVIMPLKTGNTWIGTATTYDREGNIVSVRQDTIAIVQALQIGEELWHEANGGTLYRNAADGLYTSGECICLEAKYPAAQLDTFNTLPPAQVLIPGSSEPVVQIVTSKVLATSEQVSTPAGTFRTYHYAPVIVAPAGARFLQERHSYYVPDLGPVRIDDYTGGRQEGYLSRRWELVKVTL